MRDARTRIREAVGYDTYEPRQARRSVERTLVAILVAIAAVAVALGLWAQSSRAADTSRSCASAEDARKVLIDAGEKPIFSGVASTGDLFQVWASPDGVTWTAAVTSPTGIMCIIGIGGGADLRGFFGVPS